MGAIEQAVELIRKSKRIMAFTGAGISVESGIPPFRGADNALWANVNPEVLDIDFFYSNPAVSWKFIHQMGDFMFRLQAKPNNGHKLLASLEESGKLFRVVTQNIDNLHQDAGSVAVSEFHGTAVYATCTKCGKYRKSLRDIAQTECPPLCAECNGLVKPDFVFFGEGIPEKVLSESYRATRECDLCIVIGTSGIVMPAGMIPIDAKRNGAKVIEFNTEESPFVTNGVTDVFVKGKVGETAVQIAELLGIDL